MDKWVTGINEECFDGEEYGTREDAVKYGREEYNLDPDDSFWVGKIVDPLTRISHPDFDWYWENFVELKNDEVFFGDFTESWLDKVRKDKELQALVDTKLKECFDIIQKKHPLNFFLVDDTEQV